MSVEPIVALVMLAALVTYALLAGADFGGGIWDLVSQGPRASAQRAKIAEAIGPVWEANHVWLIFLVVLSFTCFPAVYAAASTALFWPLHLVLIGIVLRGAAFVFRAYGSDSAQGRAAWGTIFGAASSLTPVLLGMCLGAISTGGIRGDAGTLQPGSGTAWLGLLPFAIGVLALLLCAYLAAVYLAWESDGQLQEDFRTRALVTWLLAGIVSVATIFVAQADAPRLWQRLLQPPALFFVLAGGALAPASFVALWRRRFRWSRILGAGQVIALLLGWAAAQWPYLIYPDFTVFTSAADPATLRFTLWTLPFGLGLLVPSLWFLFRVFKTRQDGDRPGA